ncbi:MAG: hypothetical protein L0Y36_00025 [Planctomycetales bacterium]|nr:hypothetical protein [Planctomycetales bacterium]
MTVHLAVSLLTLALLCGTLRALARSGEPAPRVSWLPLAAMIPPLLPMSFGPIVPISHYVFEATSDNITWYAVTGVALWGLTGFFLWRYAKRRPGLANLLALGLLWGIMGFWYGLGVTLSRHEGGRKTPDVTDAGLYLAHWASVHLTLLCVFLLLALSRAYRGRWLRFIVTGLLFVPYFVLARGAIYDLTAWLSAR